MSIMAQPVTSIIMPTFNRAHIISEAIQSALAQTDPNWELIIVDDGSSDATKQIIASMKDERIRYVFQQNAGAASARNRGLSLAKGEWVAYLDSDNELLPDYLTVMHTHLNERANVMFALPRARRILELYENGTLVKTIAGDEDITKHNITIHDIFMRTFHVDTNGLMHRLAVFRDGITWDAALPVMEDWDLALSIGEKYPHGFLFVDNILCTYYQRFGGDGMRSNSTYADSADAFEMIYQKHKNDRLMKGQSWYPAGVARWRQRERYYQSGKLPPYAHFYFMGTATQSTEPGRNF
jgi:glycosyltransferase involved in cell wall biosynthesis